jgi:hypothetical protein
MMFPCLFVQGADKNCQEVGGAILTNYIPEAGTITIFNGKPGGMQVNFVSIAHRLLLRLCRYEEVISGSCRARIGDRHFGDSIGRRGLPRPRLERRILAS